MTESLWKRLGLIVAIVELKPGIGRTALVKLLYFLKELKQIDVGYDFQLFVYGPYDSDVLDDLCYAESLGAVASEIEYNQVGYGYRIKKGEDGDAIKERAVSFLREAKDAVECVANEFGDLSASELELLSTIVFVDREVHNKNATLDRDEFIERVRNIKPRFTPDYIGDKIAELSQKKIVLALSHQP